MSIENRQQNELTNVVSVEMTDVCMDPTQLSIYICIVGISEI